MFVSIWLRPVCTVCFAFFQACEECKAISRKLHEKPNSIEELTDQREWMKQISDQLKAHEVQRINYTDLQRIEYIIFGTVKIILLIREFSFCVSLSSGAPIQSHVRLRVDR